VVFQQKRNFRDWETPADVCRAFDPDSDVTIATVNKQRESGAIALKSGAITRKLKNKTS